ncbi:MAG: HNH endonuclease [Actinomycetota bacterium]|nr:HNH endonuclease [Actinomycetota bacterium]
MGSSSRGPTLRSHRTLDATSPRSAARPSHPISRIVRDTATAQRIKVLYGYHCQACGVRLETAAGPYAEAAHIRPLGAPHDGPDSADNILCLCPNHHVLFDHGGLVIKEDLSLKGEEGRLTVHPQHRIDPEHLRYRREHYARAASEPTSQRGL